MNLIKSQPAAVLQFAEACPFAANKLNLNLVKSISNFAPGSAKGGAGDGAKNVDQNNNNNNHVNNNNSVGDAVKREKPTMKSKVSFILL